MVKCVVKFAVSCQKVVVLNAIFQTEPFRHFTEANHHGLLEDVRFQIIDRVFEVSRHKEGFFAV